MQTNKTVPRGSIESKPKPGRPRKSGAATDKLIRCFLKNQFFTAVGIKKENPHVSISVRTIRRRLSEGKLHARRPAKKPFISKKNRRSRLDFATEHLNWTYDQWKQVLWSDESKFNMFGSDGMKWVRRPNNERYNPKYTTPTIKHGGGNVLVWGCFSGHGMGPLRRIEGVMDWYQYLDILRNTMLPFAEESLPLVWKFQHDNDPKHTAKIVKEFVEAEQVPVIKWLAQSPDLNPIENMWEQLEREVRQKHPEKFTNKDQLFAALSQAWSEISENKIRSLLESMPRRCAEVIKNKGFSTKY